MGELSRNVELAQQIGELFADGADAVLSDEDKSGIERVRADLQQLLEVDGGPAATTSANDAVRHAITELDGILERSAAAVQSVARQALGPERGGAGAQKEPLQVRASPEPVILDLNHFYIDGVVEGKLLALRHSVRGQTASTVKKVPKERQLQLRQEISDLDAELTQKKVNIELARGILGQLEDTIASRMGSGAEPNGAREIEGLSVTSDPVTLDLDNFFIDGAVEGELLALRLKVACTPGEPSASEQKQLKAEVDEMKAELTSMKINIALASGILGELKDGLA